MVPILERRRYPRFAVRLPFRLKRVEGKVEAQSGTLISKDVSVLLPTNLDSQGLVF